MSQIRVACVQMRSGTDVAENIDAASALIREAAGQGAELIATPEMTTLLDRKPGAVWEKSTTEDADPGLKAFRALAKELKTVLLIGSMAIRAGGRQVRQPQLPDRPGRADDRPLRQDPHVRRPAQRRQRLSRVRQLSPPAPKPSSPVFPPASSA